MNDISSVLFFTKVKKPKKKPPRKTSTTLNKIWSKFRVKPASASPACRPRPPIQKPSKSAAKLFNGIKSREILFEGMGISLVYSICKTEKGLAVGPVLHTNEVVEYLKWVCRTSQLHMNCFVVAFGYLNRLLRTREEKGHQATEPLTFTRSNWKLLVITAIMIAQKFCDDESYFNNEFAKLLGRKYTIKQLNKMEVEILAGLNWDCFFTPQEYQNCYYCIQWYALDMII